jgi:hypothetical protein
VTAAGAARAPQMRAPASAPLRLLIDQLSPEEA